MNCRNNRARVKDHIQLLLQYNIQYFLSSFSNSPPFFFFFGPLRSSSFRSFRCIYLIIGKDMFGLRDPNLYMNLFKIYRSQLIPNSIKFQQFNLKFNPHRFNESKFISNSSIYLFLFCLKRDNLTLLFIKCNNTFILIQKKCLITCYNQLLNNCTYPIK